MDCMYLHLTEVAINVLSHVLSIFKEDTGLGMGALFPG